MARARCSLRNGVVCSGSSMGNGEGRSSGGGSCSSLLMMGFTWEAWHSPSQNPPAEVTLAGAPAALAQLHGQHREASGRGKAGQAPRAGNWGLELFLSAEARSLFCTGKKGVGKVAFPSKHRVFPVH